MKYMIYIIVIMITFNGCYKHSVATNNPIIKYYTKSIEYSAKWAEYRLPYSFYNEAPSNFNFEDAVRDCQGPYDATTKVYYHNQKAYANMIPYKAISYCDDLTTPNSIKKYDSEGRIIEYNSKTFDIKYSYTEKERIEKWYNKEINTIFVSKYIYDKNKKLLKIFDTNSNGKNTVYLFDKKNKNILNEYDMSGKLTGEIRMIDEFLNN